MLTLPGHKLLQDARGARTCLLGNLAMVRGALEAGVSFFSGYPGTPSSEITDTFARLAPEAGIHFEYSINEKVAVETAFGACLAGARSMCAMKHLGLNYAGDPISTMPYVGVEGGMVIVSAGDPSAITSPNEQDQRHFSRFLYYPVLDPATPGDALQMARYAFELSEKTRLPVILRPTTRVCHTSGMVELGALPEKKKPVRFTKNPARHVPIPVNARRMRRELSERYRLARELLGDSGFFPRSGQGRFGVVGSGVAHTYAAQAVRELGADQVSLLQVGAYPIPEPVLADFLGSVEQVLVVEELTPFVEDELTLYAYRHGLRLPIYGKATGHLPTEYEYDPDLVEDALRSYLGLPPSGGRKGDPGPAVAVEVPDLPARPPVLCPGCPHRASFYLVRRVFGKRTVYCNDIGCYTLGYGPPLHSCDVLLCMGSSITQASGIARTTGERVVAYLGDSTFFHSGLPGLANALNQGDPITVVILDNGVSAMTGFQPSPALSIEQAVRGLGATAVYSVDPFDEPGALAVLKQAKAGPGVQVVIFRSPCVLHELRSGARGPRRAYEIDQERCNACSLCVLALGCPAITVQEGRYTIVPELCDGCDICARVCQRDAIREAE